MKCAFRVCFSTLALLLTTTFVAADDTKKDPKPAAETKKPAAEAKKPSATATKEDRKPAEGAPRGERKPDGANPRGEGKPRDGGGRRSEFPAELKFTDEQQKKLTDLQAEFGGKFGELSKQRDAVYTEEQKTARAEVEKKLRDGGLNRQEYVDAMAAALKVTAEQKTKIDAVETEFAKARRDYEEQKMAVLTAEQKSTFSKLRLAQEIERMFQFPGDLTLNEEQKKGLKAVQDEFTAELTAAMEKQNTIMTDERRAAQQAVFKEAAESKKDRQALGEALDAALKLTDAEKAELKEAQGKLFDLRGKIQEKKLAVLTPEQKQEFEKKYGSRR